MAKKGMLLQLDHTYFRLLFAVSISWSGVANIDTNTAKSRTIAVRLISMALTGYYKTLVRPRQHRPLSMLKYDPVGTSYTPEESGFHALRCVCSVDKTRE